MVGFIFQLLSFRAGRPLPEPASLTWVRQKTIHVRRVPLHLFQRLDSFCPVARIFTWVPPTSTTSTFMMKPHPCLPSLRQGGALGSDYIHKLVPGIDERLGPFVLEPCGQGIDVDGGLGELVQYRFAIAAIGR